MSLPRGLMLLMLLIFARSAPAAAPTEGGPVEWFVVGQSRLDRSLEAAILGNGAERVLVVGPLAGNESKALGVLDELISFLAGQPQRLRHVTLTVLRDPNPDGRANGTRANAESVDLNRNFPTSNWRRIPDRDRWLSGREPASAAETKALIDLAELARPDRVLILAESADRGLLVANPPAQSWAQAVANRTAWRVARHDPARVSGSLARWLDEREIPTLSVLVPPGQTVQASFNQIAPALVHTLALRQIQAAVPEAAVPQSIPVSSSGPTLVGPTPAVEQELFGPLEPVRRPGRASEASGNGRQGETRPLRPFDASAAQPLENGEWPAGYRPPQPPIELDRPN